MTTKNALYVNSLVDYVKDAKPFHSKITQIMEEYRFFDNASVIVEDNLHISTHLNSIWNNDYYSDGFRTRYILPPYMTPRYSYEVNNFNYTIDHELDYLKDNFGLPNCFQLNNSLGIENVIVDGDNKLEGFDFFISKGIYSIQTVKLLHENEQHTHWYKTNVDSNQLLEGTPGYFCDNLWLPIENASVIQGQENVWRITITSNIHQPNSGVAYLDNGQQISYSGETPTCQFSISDYKTGDILGYGLDTEIFSIAPLTFTPKFRYSAVGETALIRPVNQIAFHSDSVEQKWSIIKINPIIFPIENGIIQGITFTGGNDRVGTKQLQLLVYSAGCIDAPAEQWNIVYNENLKAFNIGGSVSGIDFPAVKIGPWYDNGVIRIKLVLAPKDFPDNKSAFFNENYKDNDLYIAQYTQFAIDNLAVFNGDRFSFEISDKKANYIVYGSETKQFHFAYVGEYFWNGEIGFMPNIPWYCIDQSDVLMPSEFPEHVPMGWYDENQYDDYYDSEIIENVAGINIAYLSQSFFSSDYYPVQWNIKQGNAVYDEFLFENDPYPSSTLAIKFNKPPRFDAMEELFELTYNSHDLTNHVFEIPNKQFQVKSDKFGLLPAAIVGYDYTNFETSSLSASFGNVGALNLTILNNPDIEIPEDTKFRIKIKTNFIKPFHSKDVLILKTFDLYDKLRVTTYNNDRLQFSIKIPHPELGSGLFDETVIPTFIKPNIQSLGFLHNYEHEGYDNEYGYDEFNAYNADFKFGKQPVLPSRLGQYDLYLNNSALDSIGTISYVFDELNNTYRNVIDFNANFLSQYLPINTNFSFKAFQTDQYNQPTSVLITEHLKIAEKIKFYDSINVSVWEGNEIYSATFGYDTTLYDHFEYELEDYAPVKFASKVKVNYLLHDRETSTLIPYVEADVSKQIDTSITDNNLLISYNTTLDAYYDYHYGYDVFGYELTKEYSSYETISNLNQQLIIGGNTIICWYKTYSEVTKEIILDFPISNNFIVCSDINDIDNTQLTENVHYDIEIMDIYNGGNIIGTSYKISMIERDTNIIQLATTNNLDALSTLEFNGNPIEIDGIEVQHNDKVLVKNQTNSSENGLYRVNEFGAWELLSVNLYDYYYVVNGVQNSDKGFNIIDDINFGVLPDIDNAIIFGARPFSLILS